MKLSRNQCYLAFCAFIATIRTAGSIKCYRCTSTDIDNNTLQCNEYFEDTDLEPQSCDDIHNAQYCIKQIGRFEGFGTCGYLFCPGFGTNITTNTLNLTNEAKIGFSNGMPLTRTGKAWTIKCFQCSSSSNISCSDLLIHNGGIEPKDCDHIFEAEYCVKMTGFAQGGQIGTKRDCSSVDLGNYCNYVQLSGDVLEYRSCYFTCTGDGCNGAPSAIRNFETTAAAAAAFVLIRHLMPGTY